MRPGALWVSALCLCTAPSLAQEADKPEAVHAAKALFERANAAYKKGDLRRAYDLFAEADRQAPSPELAYNLGRTAERMGEVGLAAEHFRRYLRDGKPTKQERDDLRQRIERLRELGRRQRAQAMKPAPESASLTGEARRFFEHGLALYARGDLAGALTAFTAAQRFTELPEVYYNLAVVAERLGRRRDAMDYYRAYLRGLPRAVDRSLVEARLRDLRGRRTGR